MNGTDCIFCKIIAKQIPSEFVKETDDVIVIKDLRPKAPTHYLIIPKKHFDNIGKAQAADMPALAASLVVARQLATELPEPQAFNLIANNGESVGQSVFHMHWHFLAGANIYQSGFSL